jgi:5-carboxymethyl-2-hydroxymuconate isomerase
MLLAVNDAVVESALFIPAHIKVRALPIDHYLVGGEDQTFIHAQLRIKSGRNDTQKKLLSELVLQALVQQLEAKVVTVEVVDMDKETYAKFTANIIHD